MKARNKIYAEDCLEGIKSLESGSVDVIVTSPPYNLGTKYNAYRDIKPRIGYLDWMETVAKESKRVLKDNGSFYLNVGGSLKDPWIPIDIASMFGKHYSLQNTIHWIKSISIGDVTYGHYKPINSDRFHHDSHEFVFHFTKRGDVKIDRTANGVRYMDKTNVKRWAGNGGEDRHDRGNVWFIPYETVRSAKSHPSSFPVQLPEMCIKDAGLKPGSLVLDPFMGIGTTAVACVNLKMDYIGFEIDPSYVDIALKNVRQARKS